MACFTRIVPLNEANSLEQSSVFGECREAGNGTLGSICGYPGDEPCDNTTTCSHTLYTCVLAGQGLLGDRCGRDPHANCTTGLACTVEWGSAAEGECREPGNGTAGELCGDVIDSACVNGTACFADIGNTSRVRSILASLSSSFSSAFSVLLSNF